MQGASFRDSTRREARSLGITAWARNRAGGSAEVWAEGEQATVGTLLEWCREGPPHATAENMLIEGEKPAGPTGFGVR